MKAINTLYETIGLNIRKLRQAKNITQQALSDSVDLTRTSLVHIEKGQQRLTIERLYKISNILNVSIEKILPLRYKDKDNITENYINQNIEFSDVKISELIEKIKELQDAFKFHCCQVTCSQIIGMIEDQESKPFNPCECGFTEFEIDEKERYYKIHSGLVIVIEKDEKENSFILQSFVKKYSFDKSNLTKLLEEGECLTYMYFTAPNHRQGVELLRNLGKIE